MSSVFRHVWSAQTARMFFQVRPTAGFRNSKDNFIGLHLVRSTEKMGGNGVWDFRDAQAVVAVNNDSLTAGNQLAVQKQLNGVVDLTIQLDDRTAGQLEHFTQGQLTLAEAKRDIQLDVHNQLEVDGIDGRVLRVG